MTTFKLPAPREEVGGGTPLAAALLYPAFLVPDTAVGSSRWALSFLCPTKGTQGRTEATAGGHWWGIGTTKVQNLGHLETNT